ncbi:hypothetical protein [Pontibacillus salipaludis]|uniref:Uncharacterized protein n=1 Tax=Pontibacillus salipaludis TaxID=1697394 RepID=A0ABQ1PI64_9BACI|nr:hypothetical protein [Pontibacillus salipaludis]GGC97746.1 hypothetical protein GCM10011389_01100 [Pontibacillus salipaludis]
MSDNKDASNSLKNAAVKSGETLITTIIEESGKALTQWAKRRIE